MGGDGFENKRERCHEKPGADASEGVLLEHLPADLQKKGDAHPGEQRGHRATADSHQAGYPGAEMDHRARQEENARDKKRAGIKAIQFFLLRCRITFALYYSERTKRPSFRNDESTSMKGCHPCPIVQADLNKRDSFHDL